MEEFHKAVAVEEVNTAEQLQSSERREQLSQIVSLRSENRSDGGQTPPSWFCAEVSVHFSDDVVVEGKAGLTH